MADVAPLKASEEVTVSGSVYRKAKAEVSERVIDLGNVRAGGSFVAGRMSVKNGAREDGYSDDLRVEFGEASGGFVAKGAGLVLGAQKAGDIAFGYEGSTMEGGLKSGKVTLGMVSRGVAGSGLSDVDLGEVSVSVRGRVYRAAKGEVESGTLDLGNIHLGEKFETGVIGVRNAVVADGYSERLNVEMLSLIHI